MDPNTAVTLKADTKKFPRLSTFTFIHRRVHRFEHRTPTFSLFSAGVDETMRQLSTPPGAECPRFLALGEAPGDRVTKDRQGSRGAANGDGTRGGDSGPRCLESGPLSDFLMIYKYILIFVPQLR